MPRLWKTKAGGCPRASGLGREFELAIMKGMKGVKNVWNNRLEQLLAEETLPASYRQLVETWLAPLAEWLCRLRREPGRPLLVGVHGAQGTGKTTLCRVLELLLVQKNWRALTLSLDDFYFSRARRRQLAKEVHPLLITRGVPGTHDIELLTQTLDRLVAVEPVSLPRFNKATDDCEPVSAWPRVGGELDIIFLEGWCVGCRAVAESVLELPVNALETEEDVDGSWRAYVNSCLAGEYTDLFQRLDALVMLKAPSMEQVLEWRCLQESKLAQRGEGGGVMSRPEIQRFVQHYERITRHALAEMPGRADYLLELGADHDIIAAHNT
jgi:D-glycerate 3-kinase